MHEAIQYSTRYAKRGTVGSKLISLGHRGHELPGEDHSDK